MVKQGNHHNVLLLKKPSQGLIKLTQKAKQQANIQAKLQNNDLSSANNYVEGMTPCFKSFFLNRIQPNWFRYEFLTCRFEFAYNKVMTKVLWTWWSYASPWECHHPQQVWACSKTVRNVSRKLYWIWLGCSRTLKSTAPSSPSMGTSTMLIQPINVQNES